MSIQTDITSTANQYGVPPAIALSVAQRESGFRQSAIGAAGEVGIYQLMPATAADLGVDPYNAQGNIDGGIRYLAQLYNQFGNWEAALAAYNGGPGNMTRGTTPSISWDYARSVLAAAGLYSQPAPQGLPADFSGGGTSYASLFPEGIPNWAILAILGAMAVGWIVLRD